MPHLSENLISDWPPCDEQVRSTWKIMEIPVNIHVIHDSKVKDDPGKVPEQELDEQLVILNKAFEKGLIKFSLVSVGYHNKSEWFRLGLGGDEEKVAKTALGRDTESSLNFYVANLRGTGSNGYAHQPWEYRHFPELDGVVVHFRYLPGGPEPYHMGGLGVHEVGHWLGLHHTFEGLGNGDRDGVPDTPPQIVPTLCNLDVEWDRSVRCSADQPARNYMDQICDCAKNEFTLDQMCRIRNVILKKYRPNLLP